MQCTNCKEDLDISCFNKDSSKITGYYPRCKKCRAAYRNETKEHIQQKNKQYWLANKLLLSAKNAQYYEINKNTIQEQKKEYRNKTKDVSAKRDKIRYTLKKDIICKQKKEYYIKNKESIISKKREYLIRKGTSTLTARRLCSFVHKPSILQRDCYKCVICLTKSDLILHHIIPVAENAAKILDLDNLVTLCKRCHLQIAHGGSFKKLNSRIQALLIAYVSAL